MSNPFQATYLVIDDEGISFFKQSGTMVIKYNQEMFVYDGTLPGRFQMIYNLKRGLGWDMGEELVDLRDLRGMLGFVCGTVSLAPHGASFSCTQVTIPRWFFIVSGVAPSVILFGRSMRRRVQMNRYRQRHLCPDCGYDMRATSARCPECGFVPAHIDPMLVPAARNAISNLKTSTADRTNPIDT